MTAQSIHELDTVFSSPGGEPIGVAAWGGVETNQSSHLGISVL